MAITEPITGGAHGRPFGAALPDLVALGYREDEYLVSGEAVRYRPAEPLSPDGRWTVRPTSRVRFHTRVLVRCPADPARFTGTVVVEWLNVSAGFDVSFACPGTLTDGLAHVGVSAQPLGVHGFPSDPHGLRHWDPDRYGALDVPDDAVGYDILTQVAGALREAGSPLLRGCRARRLILVGVSQSGTRVLAYANGVQPRTGAFDALVPVVCAGMAADFDPATAHPDRAAGDRGHSRSLRTRVRDDLATSVFALDTETEALHHAPYRRPDTGRYRHWEIAGAAHAPAAQLAAITAVTERDGVPTPAWTGPEPSRVEWLPTFDAIVVHLGRWLDDGRPPPIQPPIELTANGAQLARDEHGNARGGVRLPELEVPVATYRGTDPDARLGGRTTPFPPDKLARLYPDHAGYVRQVEAAAQAAVEAGVILPVRAAAYARAAEHAPVPEP
jgi:hypothetical protein